MKAVILAAGRGSRMKDATGERPKCLVELMGKPLLRWQLDALERGGVEEILIVRGYLAESICGNFVTVENPRWAVSNMVETLRYAAPWLRESPCIVSYSDIVYSYKHIAKIAKSHHDIAITYDICWEALWRLRFEDPLTDAETFRQEDGFLEEIGGHPRSIKEIRGQYMGLFFITPHGWKIIDKILSQLKQIEIDNLDMTALLQLLLKKGIRIGAIPVEGGWVEADSMNDIRAYEDILSKKTSWSHDWRK